MTRDIKNVKNAVELDLGDGLTAVVRLQEANESLKEDLKQASLAYARVSVEVDVVRRLSAMLRTETELREEQVAWFQAKLTELSNLLEQERAANAMLAAKSRQIAELEQASAATSFRQSLEELLHATQASIAFRLGGRRSRGGGDDR